MTEAPVIGWKRVESPDYPGGVYPWVESRDINDLTLPYDQFVAASTIQGAIAELEMRCPAPVPDQLVRVTYGRHKRTGRGWRAHSQYVLLTFEQSPFLVNSHIALVLLESFVAAHGEILCTLDAADVISGLPGAEDSPLTVGKTGSMFARLRINASRPQARRTRAKNDDEAWSKFREVDAKALRVRRFASELAIVLRLEVCLAKPELGPAIVIPKRDELRSTHSARSRPTINRVPDQPTLAQRFECWRDLNRMALLHTLVFGGTVYRRHELWRRMRAAYQDLPKLLRTDVELRAWWGWSPRLDQFIMGELTARKPRGSDFTVNTEVENP